MQDEGREVEEGDVKDSRGWESRRSDRNGRWTWIDLWDAVALTSLTWRTPPRLSASDSNAPARITTGTTPKTPNPKRRTVEDANLRRGFWSNCSL